MGDRIRSRKLITPRVLAGFPYGCRTCTAPERFYGPLGGMRVLRSFRLRLRVNSGRGSINALDLRATYARDDEAAGVRFFICRPSDVIGTPCAAVTQGVGPATTQAGVWRR